MGTLNFNDIFKKGFTKLNVFTEVSIIDVLLCFIMALAVALFIFYIYKKVYRGVVYSHNFNVSLVMMTIITAFVIMTISSNIILSLGMVGALSIVRFRTALKDPMDIVFMFWAIGAGIMSGAGIYPIAIIGSILIGLVLVVMLNSTPTESDYLLVIHCQEKAVEAVGMDLRKLKCTTKSKILGRESIEWVSQIKVKGDNTAFMKEISAIEGVIDVSLVSYNGEYAS